MYYIYLIPSQRISLVFELLNHFFSMLMEKLVIFLILGNPSDDLSYFSLSNFVGNT